MVSDEEQEGNRCEAMHCEIRVKGHLSDKWDDWFDGLDIENQPNGEAALSGTLLDQAALCGVLKRVCNLGLAIISVTCTEVAPEVASAPSRASTERGEEAGQSFHASQAESP